MKNLEAQQVTVFVNDYHKFVHVGVYNMYDKEGRPNYGATLQSQYRESQRAIHHANKEDPKGTDNCFSSSFQVRLMNTPIDQWEVTSNIRDLDIAQARVISTELSDLLEAEGYNVTGIRGNKAIRHLGTSKYANNVVIKNATMKKIYQIVEKITEGHHSILNMRRIQSAIYTRYIKVDGNFDTRRKFWNFINENFDNFAMRCL